MSLLAREGLGDNLRFLLVEVSRQVERAASYLAAPTAAKTRELLSRDDYIDQLKSTISRQCLKLETAASTSEPDRKVLKTLEVVSANLERIADFCENIVDYATHVPHEDVGVEYDFSGFAAVVLDGLSLVEGALADSDVKTALEICKLERDLDTMYETCLRRVTRALASGAHTKRRIAAVFIAHYFERMGDALENIGEAIISWLLGDRLKIQQISALGNVLPETGDLSSLEALELEEVGETRSGCHISRVREAGGNRLAIFKEGKLRKLASERQSVAEWERLMPGLVANIYSFHVRGDTGAVLYEYLEGATFQQLLLSGDDRDVEAAAAAIAETLTMIWERTASDAPSQPRFVGQLRSRLAEVYAVHPEFRHRHQRIAGRDHASFDELIERVASLDDELVAPSVRIHGDLNVDNIIYRPGEGTIRLIDVHRSRTMDLVQDITVLMVSGQRLRRLEEPVRRRINRVTLWLLGIARQYAERRGDPTFDLRVALGMARSLATSTRFVLDRDLATSMFLRARFLLEDIGARGLGDPAGYRLLPEALVA